MESEEKSPLDILKQALFLERQGKAFYTTAAEQSGNEDLRNFFATMAEEEDRHIHYLTNQFSFYSQKGEFLKDDPMAKVSDAAEKVLSKEITSAINGASYEAAAVSAAIEMEKKAVALYGDRAKTSSDKTEKELYDMLAKWETSHLSLLNDINNAIVESAWNDNSFWPY